jgi:hypothetical protein
LLKKLDKYFNFIAEWCANNIMKELEKIQESWLYEKRRKKMVFEEKRNETLFFFLKFNKNDKNKEED